MISLKNTSNIEEIQKYLALITVLSIYLCLVKYEHNLYFGLIGTILLKKYATPTSYALFRYVDNQ